MPGEKYLALIDAIKKKDPELLKTGLNIVLYQQGLTQDNINALCEAIEEFPEYKAAIIGIRLDNSVLPSPDRNSCKSLYLAGYNSLAWVSLIYSNCEALEIRDCPNLSRIYCSGNPTLLTAHRNGGSRISIVNCPKARRLSQTRTLQRFDTETNESDDPDADKIYYAPQRLVRTAATGKSPVLFSKETAPAPLCHSSLVAVPLPQVLPLSKLGIDEAIPEGDEEAEDTDEPQTPGAKFTVSSVSTTSTATRGSDLSGVDPNSPGASANHVGRGSRKPRERGGTIVPGRLSLKSMFPSS